MERLKHIVQINILLGAWLVIAPFVLRYQRMSRPFANDIAVGIVALIVSVTATWIASSRPTTAA